MTSTPVLSVVFFQANTVKGYAITSNTFTGDSASNEGGAIENGGTLSFGGTIIANSPSGGNCFRSSGSLTDTGYNLSDDSSCGFSVANHDLLTTNPQLGPLQNNGGPTPTMALLPNSPALNQIPTSDASLCPAPGTDQRGLPRPDARESFCDIGAYGSSSTASTTTTLTASANPATAGQPVTFTATVTPSWGTATPTGTVRFSINGTPFGSQVSLGGAKAPAPPSPLFLPATTPSRPPTAVIPTTWAAPTP